jgi:hypothetical protein
MTLEEAIQHLRESLADPTHKWGCEECKQEHEQLLVWLEDYKRLLSESSWIPCEERMPEAGLSKWVLVSDVDGFVFMATRDLHNWESFNDGLPIDFETITHWMPRPHPPKEVEE